jgi:four helix bundle protein
MSRGEQFEDLLVWQKSMALTTQIYRLCQQGALSKDWGMRDQMQRAAVSIAANIAEGYERGGRKEYIQFLNIAKGSVGELRCLVTIASRLHYADEAVLKDLSDNSEEISRMLKGLINSLRL